MAIQSNCGICLSRTRTHDLHAPSLFPCRPAQHKWTRNVFICVVYVDHACCSIHKNGSWYYTHSFVKKSLSLPFSLSLSIPLFLAHTGDTIYVHNTDHPVRQSLSLPKAIWILPRSLYSFCSFFDFKEKRLRHTEDGFLKTYALRDLGTADQYWANRGNVVSKKY